MSFTDTPYTFLELRVDMFPPSEEQIDGPAFWWYCQSCGGEGYRSNGGGGKYSSKHSLNQVWTDYKRHLQRSHSLPEPKPKCIFTTTIQDTEYFCTEEVHPGEPHTLIGRR